MKKNEDFIIIIGCGKFGSAIAETLSQERKSIVIIDTDQNSFRKLSDNFSGISMESNGIEVDTLESANIASAGTVLACTSDDNTNIMIAQIAKEIYGVPKVIARIFHSNAATIYEQFNIETINPVELAKTEFNKIRFSLDEVNK